MPIGKLADTSAAPTPAASKSEEPAAATTPSNEAEPPLARRHAERLVSAIAVTVAVRRTSLRLGNRTTASPAIVVVISRISSARCSRGPWRPRPPPAWGRLKRVSLNTGPRRSACNHSVADEVWDPVVSIAQLDVRAEN